jgi:hypothetical protein
MRYLLAFTSLVLFLASCRGSLAADSCATHTFQIACEVDKACEWNAKRRQCKVKAKEKKDPCSVNMSAWYCNNDTTNKCDWDRRAEKCQRSKGISPGNR